MGTKGHTRHATNLKGWVRNMYKHAMLIMFITCYILLALPTKKARILCLDSL
jgi:hypothetical protein